jgi:hypothetical protein
MNGSSGYTHGLGAAQEGALDLEELGAERLSPAVDLKMRKLKKKGSVKEKRPGTICFPQPLHPQEQRPVRHPPG